jgi:hypothetical protein
MVVQSADTVTEFAIGLIREVVRNELEIRHLHCGERFLG